MGSGKTVTADRLAARLGLPWADMDALIEKRSGRLIPEIFSAEGEMRFRELESAALESLEPGKQEIVATGGGIVTRPQNIAWMKKNGKIIYLESSVETLFKRTRRAANRPLLSGADPKEALQRIFLERKAFYEMSADLRIVTDGRTADQVAAEIQAVLEKKDL